MPEFDDSLGGPEEERDQNGYRLMFPGAAIEKALDPSKPVYRPSDSPAQPAEVQPPAMADVLRSAPGSAPAPTGLPSSLTRSSPTPADIPAPPTGVGNMRRMELLRQMGTLETPIAKGTTDPTTGKTQISPKYRMSLGQRILGSLVNFGQGFGRTGGEPVHVGPGAVNQQYYSDEAQREKTLGGVKEELGAQEKLDTSEQKIYEDAVKQAYEGQLGEARLGLSNAAAQNADTRAQLATTTGELNEARAGKLTDPIGQRIQEADRQGLKGEDRKYYIANGKLKEGSDRAPTELEEWSAAFRRDNGRAPTADEIANRKSRTSTLSDKIEADKDKALKDAEEKATKRLDDTMKRMFVTDPMSADPRFVTAKNAIYADLEKEKTQIQQEYETRARQNAQTRTTAKPAAPTTKPATSATPTKSPKVGDVVTVKGKQYTVGKVYPNGSWDPK